MKIKSTLLSLFAVCLTICCLNACGKEEPAVVDYRFTVPSGFEETQPPEGIAFYYINKADGSSINMNIQEKDPGFRSLTCDALREILEESLSRAYAAEVAITDQYFHTDDIDGYPSYQYSFSYELAGLPISQILVGIDADQTYTFTYTDMSGGSWLETFEEIIPAIDLITEQE